MAYQNDLLYLLSIQRVLYLQNQFDWNDVLILLDMLEGVIGQRTDKEIPNSTDKWSDSSFPESTIPKFSEWKPDWTSGAFIEKKIISLLQKYIHMYNQDQSNHEPITISEAVLLSPQDQLDIFRLTIDKLVQFIKQKRVDMLKSSFMLLDEDAQRLYMEKYKKLDRLKEEELRANDLAIRAKIEVEKAQAIRESLLNVHQLISSPSSSPLLKQIPTQSIDEMRPVDSPGTIEPATLKPASIISPTSTFRKEWKKSMIALIKDLYNHKHGPIFSSPVRADDAPFYYEVIRKPLYLNLIRNRIRDDIYTSTDEVYRDLLLLFYNALVYNGPGTIIHQMALEMIDSTNELMEAFKIKETLSSLNEKDEKASFPPSSSSSSSQSLHRQSLRQDLQNS